MLINDTHDENILKGLKNKKFRMYIICKSFVYMVGSRITIVFTIIDSINLSISLTMSILFNLYTHWENQL